MIAKVSAKYFVSFLDKGDIDVFLMQIKALYDSYKDYDNIISLYMQEDSNTLILIKDGYAIVCVGQSIKRKQRIELAEFLQNNAYSIFCKIKLPFKAFLRESGNTFLKEKLTGQKTHDVITSVKEACDILSEVFPSYKSKESKDALYCDMSHRIRHGVSKVYTIKEASTLTAYGKVKNNVLLCDAATLYKYRRQGLFKRLLLHMISDFGCPINIHAASRTKESDKVYKKLRFVKQYKWYLYSKQEN